MTARKARPPKGALTTPDMSMRDLASALDMSTGFLARCKRLAAIPQDEFERRIERGRANTMTEKKPRGITTEAILRDEPVPVPGRVRRALGIYRRMTPAERAQLRAIIGREEA
jgi:hypothetical protein